MQADFLFFLQRLSNPTLDKIFTTITNIGSETFYVIIITYVFWCVNKRLGTKLFVITMLSTYINTVLKEVFRTERPIYYEGINSIYTESAPGYSFPSGHTQISSTFWIYLMYRIRNKSMYIIGTILIFLVGFSRLYLRVHWPIDILGGIIIALGIAFLGDYVIEKVIRLKYNYTFTILLSMIIPTALLFIFTTEENIKILALMTGALVGFFTEEKLIGFKEDSDRIKQYQKYILGLGIFLILKSGLKMILPVSPLFMYFRYLLLGLWITLLAPYLFVKTNLSNSNKRHS